jgi:histidine triad (HIT) family protein
MAYDSRNIFARILRGDLPSTKIYEDERTLAFLDIMPSAKGHTLVIPKESAETILELSSADASALIITTQRVARAVKTALACDGIMLVQLNGAAAGQSVAHVHFHVLPREHGLDLNLHGRIKADPGELEVIAAMIREHM